MDVSVLPNNNHPEKFLQLDIRMLPAAHGMFQVGAIMSSQKQWQNRIYSQKAGGAESSTLSPREPRVKTGSRPAPSPEDSPVMFVDRYLEKHITPATLKSNIKQNPLYIKTVDAGDNEMSHPSWTIKDFDTQTPHGNLSDYLQETGKTPKDLDFWLEELYTPGFDSLLKRKEAEHRRRLCKILSSIIVSVFALIIIIVLVIVLLKKT